MRDLDHQKSARWPNYKMFLALLLALILESYLGFDIAGLKFNFDFLLPLIIVYTIWANDRQSLVFTLVAGFISDYLAAPTMGVGTLPFLLVCAASSQLRRFRDKPIFLLLAYLPLRLGYILVLAATKTIAVWQLYIEAAFFNYLRELGLSSLLGLPLDLLAVAIFIFIAYQLDQTNVLETKQRRFAELWR